MKSEELKGTTRAKDIIIIFLLKESDVKNT